MRRSFAKRQDGYQEENGKEKKGMIKERPAFSRRNDKNGTAEGQRRDELLEFELCAVHDGKLRLRKKQDRKRVSLKVKNWGRNARTGRVSVGECLKNDYP